MEVAPKASAGSHKWLRHSKTSLLSGLSGLNCRTSRERTLKAQRQVHAEFIVNHSSKIQLFLFLIYKHDNLCLKLPETLVVMKDIGKALIWHYDKGKVYVAYPEDPIEEFLTLTQPPCDSKYLTPQYIYSTEHETQVLSDEKSYRALLRTSESRLIIVQRYLTSPFRTVRKYRLCWDRGAAYSIHLVTNKNNLMRNPQYVEERAQSPVGSYMHSIRDYFFAGRLLKSSFSPHLPFKSSLPEIRRPQEKKSQGKTVKRKIKQFKSSLDLTLKGDQGPFLAKQAEQPLNVKLATRSLDSEKMIDELLSLVDSWQKTFMGGVASAGTFDFMADEAGDWYLIGCKIKGIDWNLLVQSLLPASPSKRVNKDTLAERLFFGREVGVIVQDYMLEERFRTLNSRIKSLASISKSFRLPGDSPFRKPTLFSNKLIRKLDCESN